MRKDVMVFMVLLALTSVLAGAAAAKVIAAVSEFIAGMMLMTGLFVGVIIIDPVVDELIAKMFKKEQD